MATGLTINQITRIDFSGITGNDILPIWDTDSNTTKSMYLSGLTEYVINNTSDTYITGGTYSNGTITLENNTGGTIDINGLVSADTKYNLDVIQIGQDVNMTLIGSDLSLDSVILKPGNNITINDNGNSEITFSVIGLSDTHITGGTYSAGTITLENNTGGTFDISGLVSTDTKYIINSTQLSPDIIDIYLLGTDSTLDTIRLKSGNNIVINDNGSSDITISTSGTQQDLSSVMNLGSTANTTTDLVYQQNNKDRLIIDSGTTKIFESLDISSENTYGLLRTNPNVLSIEAPEYTIDDEAIYISGFTGITTFGGIYPPRTNGSNIGVGSFVTGFLNNAPGYGSITMAGNSTTSGNYSFTQGENNTSTGFASQAIGFYTNATGDYSLAKGYYVDATYFTSMALGGFVKSNATSSLALGNGYSNNGAINSATRWVIAGGQGATNISTVNSSYPSNGVGAAATRSHIYGGLNNQISSNSTGSMIINSVGTILTGASINTTVIGLSGVTISGKSNSVVTRNLAIYDQPLTGDSNYEILVRDKTTGEIKVLADPFGTTAERPLTPYNGQMFLDSTIGYPIWYNGSNWINFSGGTV